MDISSDCPGNPAANPLMPKLKPLTDEELKATYAEIAERENQREVLRAVFPGAYDAILDALFRHDPIRICMPDNPDREKEYELEVGTILPRLFRASTPDDVLTVVYQEFVRWFGRTAGPIERYQAIAHELWQTPVIRKQILEQKPMPKMKSATPVFLVEDIEATLQWYEKVLGFQGEGYPPSRTFQFGILTCDDIVIMLQRLKGYKKPGLYESRDGGVWDVYMRTDDVQGLYTKLMEANSVRIIEPINDQPYGETEFVIEDLNGYVLVFSQPTPPEGWPQEHTSGIST